MKIRTGFVSNSSSSSFICEVCGEEISGMDLSAREVNMYVCKNYHRFCTDYTLEGFNEWLEQQANDLSERDFEDLEDKLYYGELPVEFCPICQFKSYSETELLKYLVKSSGKSIKEHLKDMKFRFDSYVNFLEYIK